VKSGTDLASDILKIYAKNLGAYEAKLERCKSPNIRCLGKWRIKYAKSALNDLYSQFGMAKPTKSESKKLTIDDIFTEIQKLGLQVSGVNQNVNSSNSNTASTAATTAAKSATGAVAGGASTLLFAMAGVLLFFYFWKR
jgi:hypothetical protein